MGTSGTSKSLRKKFRPNWLITLLSQFHLVQPYTHCFKKSVEPSPVIDFRAVNAVTRPDPYPMLILSDNFFSFGDARATIFSTSDLKSGFHQIGVDNFAFKRLPSGISKSRYVPTLHGYRPEEPHVENRSLFLGHRESRRIA